MLTQVGKYQIVEKIGVGGFGTVYKGRDPFIKRAVAIKTCQSAEEEIKKRFFREAEFAGNLHHRNVTTIYDFGVTDDGTPYIVQEFLTGEDLDKIIKRKEQMSLKRKLRILLDVCDGLGYAHAAGIIHRDIKPSNVRILDDDTVKIMDFGIAKSMVTQSTLTQTGITLGTASYLAPEQIRGEGLDPRTDIFSLAVLAYELFTGQKPFTGDHISTVLYKIMNEIPPRPSELLPTIPRPLDNVIMRALEKDRESRPSSCAELKGELSAAGQAISEEGTTKPTQAVVSASDQTVATPSSGFSVSAAPAVRSSAAVSSRGALDAPIAISPLGKSLATSGPVSGSVADVRLRQEEPSLGAISVPAAEGHRALKIFLAAAAVLIAVGAGAYFLYLRPAPPRRTLVQPAASPPPAQETTPMTPAAASAAVAGGPPATASSASTPSTVPEPPAAASAPPAVPAPPPDIKLKEAAPPPLASVTFQSNVYAELSVDGKRLSGHLPAPLQVRLKPGRHTAVFEAPHYMKISREFDVSPEGRPETVRAEFPPRGILKIVVLPPEALGAAIKVDGASAGTAGASGMQKTVQVGSHTVQADLTGYEGQTRSVEVSEDDVTRLTIELKKK